MRIHSVALFVLGALLLLPVHAPAEEEAEGSPINDKPLAELEKIIDEHKIPQIDCDKCRFELGAVRQATAEARLFTFVRPTAVAERTALELPGETRIDADRVRVISTRFPARLVSVAVRIGDPVRKGQPIAVVESVELAQAVLDLLKRHTEHDFAVRRAERSADLWARKMIPEQEDLEARMALEMSSFEVELATHKLLLYGIEEDVIAKLDRDRHDPLSRGVVTLESPLDGRVLARDCVPGEMVPVEHGLLTLADPSTLSLVAQCRESDLPALRGFVARGGGTVEVGTRSLPGRIFHGRLVNLEAGLARETRTLPVWFSIDNADGQLAADMFCKVTLPIVTGERAWSLPEAAVMEDAGVSFVFVRVRPDLFLARPVTPGAAHDGRIALTGGITGSDEVVLEGAFLLKSDILRGKMGGGCAD